MISLDPRTLLGLPLQAARIALEQAGYGPPRVSPAVPPRARHTFLDEADWRVARVRFLPEGPELVIVPPIELCLGDDTPA